MDRILGNFVRMQVIKKSRLSFLLPRCNFETLSFEMKRAITRGGGGRKDINERDRERRKERVTRLNWKNAYVLIFSLSPFVPFNETLLK